jgi:hypothetical protein
MAPRFNSKRYSMVDRVLGWLLLLLSLGSPISDGDLCRDRRGFDSRLISFGWHSATPW